MLDEANASFINTVVTVVRYAVYVAIVLWALRLVITLLVKLWAAISDARTRGPIEKARKRLRDLGY